MKFSSSGVYELFYFHVNMGSTQLKLFVAFIPKKISTNSSKFSERFQGFKSEILEPTWSLYRNSSFFTAFGVHKTITNL